MTLLDQIKICAFGDAEVGKNCCLSCKKEINIEELNFLDKKEFEISQICPICFDEICSEEGE